jgi:hypothetical protein
MWFPLKAHQSEHSVQRSGSEVIATPRNFFG